MFSGIYSGCRVLVTGHTGFKGSWMAMWLHQLGAKVYGLSQPAATEPNLHKWVRPLMVSQVEADVRSGDDLHRAILDARPGIIFHMAAQPLVRLSYAAPADTWTTNVLGTIRLLDAVRELELPAHVVVVTSDKCYENREQLDGYREDDHLGGHDPYSSSKAAAEIAASSWHRSFFCGNPRLGNIATARAGNVIGGGDYSVDRLVPDCVRALSSNRPIIMRNPGSTRPWQHVLDCLSGYLRLGERLIVEEKSAGPSGAFNFGPDLNSVRTVQELVAEFFKHWPGREEVQGSGKAPHEAGRLQLNIGKAAKRLQWQPTWSFEQAVEKTANWYRKAHQDPAVDLLGLSLSQIEQYSEDAKAQGMAWASSPAGRRAP